jgi:hypothetical protein
VVSEEPVEEEQTRAVPAFVLVAIAKGAITGGICAVRTWQRTGNIRSTLYDCAVGFADGAIASACKKGKLVRDLWDAVQFLRTSGAFANAVQRRDYVACGRVVQDALGDKLVQIVLACW